MKKSHNNRKLKKPINSVKEHNEAESQQNANGSPARSRSIVEIKNNLFFCSLFGIKEINYSDKCDSER